MLKALWTAEKQPCEAYGPGAEVDRLGLLDQRNIEEVEAVICERNDPSFSLDENGYAHTRPGRGSAVGDRIILLVSAVVGWNGGLGSEFDGWRRGKYDTVSWGTNWLNHS